MHLRSCAAVILLSTMIPVSGAMHVLNEKETINKLQNTSTEVQKQFIIGRISDLEIDDYTTSFYSVNLIIIFYEKTSHFTGSYIGHIKGSDQRFYISKDFQFKGILTPRFICGLFRYEAPESPEIVFVKDDSARTLMVASVDLSDVLWNDIANIGTGSCTLPTSGYVTAGDMITNCQGQIELLYGPTNMILCYYEFTPAVPSIMFLVGHPGNTLHIASIEPSNVRWSDMQNIGDGTCTFPAKEYIEAGDEITNCVGTIILYYIPTGTSYSIIEFAPSMVLIKNSDDHSLTIVSVFPADAFWSDIENSGNGTCSFPSKTYVEAGDTITDCVGRITLRFIPTYDEFGTFDFV